MNDAIRSTSLGQHFPVPAPFATLFNYAIFEGHQAYMLGQILNNIVAYVFMLSAVLLFILSLALINHNMALKLKSAFVALLLFVPATLGMTGGFIDYVGHGFVVLFQERQMLILVAMIVIYVLDFVYYVAAIAYLVYSIKLAVKVNKGELSLDEEESATGEADEKEECDCAQKREELLRDIRQIVREELDRLDRVAIVKEEVVEKVVEKVEEKQEEPEEPEVEEPEAEEPEEESETPTIKSV